jgi:hypothetical protein
MTSKDIVKHNEPAIGSPNGQGYLCNFENVKHSMHQQSTLHGSTVALQVVVTSYHAAAVSNPTAMRIDTRNTPIHPTDCKGCAAVVMYPQCRAGKQDLLSWELQQPGRHGQLTNDACLIAIS